MTKSHIPSDAGSPAVVQHHPDPRWIFPQHTSQTLSMERFLPVGHLSYYFPLFILSCGNNYFIMPFVVCPFLLRSRKKHASSLCVSHTSSSLCASHTLALCYACASLLLYVSLPSQFRTCTSWLCLYLGFLLHILSQICLFQITWIICITGFELMLDAEGQTVCNQFSEKLWKAYLRIFFST